MSVQFVKRSAGDNERSEDSRHKPRSEADSRVCAVSFGPSYRYFEVDFPVGLRENQETSESDFKNLSHKYKYRATDISQTCIKSDTAVLTVTLYNHESQ